MEVLNRSIPMLSVFLYLLLFFGETLAEGVTPAEAKQLRDEVRGMFYHAFDGYMEHAFPLDELRPLSCGGEDTLGGYALTLIDSLDTLALFGDREHFAASVEWIGKNLQFDINKTVSVFETTIRILGGLLSAHLIASDFATGMRIPSYDNELLHLSEDLAQRLLPAFDTPTGIPFGSVNLLHGVDENESKITSTAGGGTLTLEFGVLSHLTNNPIYEQVAKNAVRGLWARRSNLNLVGAHINVFTGEWTQKDAGIGTSIDSFYEYLLKHGQKSYPLRPELIESTFWLYKATRDPRYLDAGRDMVASLQNGARCPCGYCHISDVESHKQEDHMESFFLAETVKYLWLLFDLAVGPDNLFENGPYKYIFTTEGHLLPATPQISLVREHCSYFGAYCRTGNLSQETYSTDISTASQETNQSRLCGGLGPISFPSDSASHGSYSMSGMIKRAFCPGLSHRQMFGIPYQASTDASQDNEPAKHRKTIFI
ncbi:alpha-mannosidase I MNS4 isoform X2 [Malania oleifera]|uniref:alpha-mannosidase I MNS4 isoform X2 n=1 Tax=Malania oleifera TaxID=397392 RepID=UPI0025AE2DDA|nr:alpha-mannosidase I MNS4 isoform X2 [Malania oleifera]